MAFKTRKKEEFLYSSPQEMYQDNKLKKIMGPLDYQAAMLDLYIKNAELYVFHSDTQFLKGSQFLMIIQL